jgi:cytoskeleton protein RodZ
LPSFGEKLKQEREKRKITLEQISLSTKIGTRMLQALEEDKFNQLPGGIFNKGFVRAYSRFVGLDEDQIVADYLQASGDAPPPSTEIASRADGLHEGITHQSVVHEYGARENAENVSRMEASADALRRQLPWGLFAAVLLAVALVLFFWSHRQRERVRQSARPAPTSSAIPLPPTQLSGKASGENTASSPPGRSVSSATSAAAPGEFTVAIQAREESWISITADGRSIASELLAPGSERQIRARKEIIVKEGNAGAVDFRLNGTKLVTGGEFGEVKTVTFGPRGILPNAPAATATP